MTNFGRLRLLRWNSTGAHIIQLDILSLVVSCVGDLLRQFCVSHMPWRFEAFYNFDWFWCFFGAASMMGTHDDYICLIACFVMSAKLGFEIWTGCDDFVRWFGVVFLLIRLCWT